MGSVTKIHKGKRRTIALPLAYALLSSKQMVQYKAVLQAIVDAANEFNIPNCYPKKLMCDFELGIIAACREIFPESEVKCCYFHLKQFLYRKVQSLGLQTIYNDPTDRNVKLYVHMIAALAFVPVRDVQKKFRILK